MEQIIDLIIYSAHSNPFQEKAVRTSTYIIRISSSDSAKKEKKKEKKDIFPDTEAQGTELIIHSETTQYNELRSAGGISVPVTSSETPTKTQAQGYILIIVLPSC